MPAVPNPLLQQYMKLTEFLGLTLGPDYEVALHDLTNKDRSIIAIANNHISGREIGAPLTNMALGILRDRSYETNDYCLQYHGISVNGKDLRSNTFFIKQDGRLIGMLCINFDDSRYQDVCDRILELCHPDSFVTNVLMQPSMSRPPGRSPRPGEIPQFRRCSSGGRHQPGAGPHGRCPGAAHFRRAAEGHHGAGGQRHVPAERRGQKRRRQPALLAGQHLPLSRAGQEPGSRADLIVPRLAIRQRVSPAARFHLITGAARTRRHPHVPGILPQTGTAAERSGSQRRGHRSDASGQYRSGAVERSPAGDVQNLRHYLRHRRQYRGRSGHRLAFFCGESFGWERWPTFSSAP